MKKAQTKPKTGETGESGMIGNDNVIGSQKRLAELAGVSLATIHNFFNRPHLVREKTRERIQKLILETDYHPNQMARAMVRGKTNAIGVIVPRLEVAYYAKLFSSIERAANAQGYRCLVCQHLDDPRKEEQEIQVLRQWRVDGMIVRGCGRDQDDGLFRKLIRAKVAYVHLDSLVKGIEEYCVIGDDRRDAERLVAHLISKGHRRIAYVGFHRSGDFRLSDRYLGYLDALEAAGIPFDPLLTEGLRAEYDGGRAEVKRLLQCDQAKQPTAVFAFNDHSALGVLKGVAETGAEVEVAGFGGYLDAFVTSVPISTTVQNTDAIGRSAFELLEDQISGRNQMKGPIFVSGNLRLADESADLEAEVAG